MKAHVPLAIALWLGVIAAGVAAAQSTIPGAGGVPKGDNTGLSAATEQVLRTVGSSNLFEIESGRLALSRSRSAKIREFADRMVNEHADVANRTKQALTDMGLTMPPVMLNAKDQQQLDRLKAASADSFEQEYVEAQLQAHADAIALLLDYTRNGDDPRFRALAAKVLPALQHHLEQARTLR